MAADTFLVIKEPVTQQLELTQIDNSFIFLVTPPKLNSHRNKIPGAI